MSKKKTQFNQTMKNKSWINIHACISSFTCIPLSGLTCSFMLLTSKKNNLHNYCCGRKKIINVHRFHWFMKTFNIVLYLLKVFQSNPWRQGKVYRNLKKNRFKPATQVVHNIIQLLEEKKYVSLFSSKIFKSNGLFKYTIK